MKVIEKSLQTLPQSALRIAAAMETAATTVVEQGRTFAAEVTACATSLSADMKAIADQMAAIPALLDPAPILACCTEVLETAASDLRRLATDAAAIPQRLVAQTASVQQVVDQAAAAAKALCDLLPTLAELVPDFSPQLSFFNSLPARGNALAGQAMRSSALFEQYGSQLLPLSAQVAQLGVSGAASGAASQLLQSQALALQHDSLAQVALLRGTLQGDAADLESGVVDASAKVSQTILAVANLVRQKGDQLMAPLQAQIALVDQVKDALRDEAAACDALFDDGMAQLDRLGDILLKPVAAARAQVDAVIDQLAAAAASVDAMVRKALTPLDALERRVEAITQALEDAVGVVGEEVTQVQVLLAELDTEADDAKASLMTLPENFVPVRTKIAEAVALLVEIQGRIPGFVAEANRALDAAAAELDQAEVLCNHAIEICTLYMMKAPPLMLARMLFVGVKAMIPGVKGAIASARQAVKTAGTQASGLMDQAIALVQALNPLLDQAIAKVQVAIDALVDLLEQLQTALHQVSDAAGAIPPALLQQIKTASTALHAVLDKVRAAADECLAQLQCEALVRRLQQQLRDLLDRTFDPLDAKIREASGPLRQALQQGREGVAQAAELAQEGLRGLGQVLSDTEEAARQPMTQLADTVASWEPGMTSMGSTAQQKISQAAAQALSLVDQVAQKIAGLNIGALAMPAGAVAMLDGVSAAFSQVQSDASSAADKRASIDSWVADARQVVAQAAASIDNAVTEVGQGIAEIRSASDRTSADAQAASDSMSDDASVAAQVEASFDGMKQEAQAVADSANAALDEMSGSLEEARAQSETVVDSYAPVSQQALANAQAQFDGATDIAEETKKSEQALADEIAAAEQNVGAASRDAGTQTTDLKDTAQAGIDKTLEDIKSVQAQVEAARTDVIAAEAIVDAEVVKYGGTTSRIDPGADPVA
ncbi:MAG: hypothetical protein H7315_22690, partial [Herminiimonas sp.]|nr:hypothetical protein [Herminiimonas sp.]